MQSNIMVNKLLEYMQICLSTYIGEDYFLLIMIVSNHIKLIYLIN